MNHNLQPNIAQSNAITESRNDLNRIEKNAVYCIISQVRKEYIETPTNPQMAYQNMRITIPEAILSKIADDTHRTEAKKALINLRHRDITIEDEYGNWLHTGFITMAKYEAATKTFTIEVSSEIMPYLVDLARRYTSYSLTVAISLKSKWAQRFYELCCQYRNHFENGIPTFHKDISQLRYMFMLESKYPLLSDFKRRVLDKAQSELKKAYDESQCDLWFEYEQTGKGEEAQFTFLIHTKEQNQTQQKQFKELRDMSYYIYKTLLSLFPKDTKFCEKCRKHLDFHPEIVESVYKKMERIFKNYPKADRARLTRFMLAEDFKMSKESLKG